MLQKNSARFQLENWSAQLGSTWLGNFSARKILAWAHHYFLPESGKEVENKLK
jgi:hypothetical protein